jgi:hypothetical protein
VTASNESIEHAREARPPLPEPVLTESATDIDAESAGEMEWEANASVLGARHGGARTATLSVELEWRVLRELGLRLEPSFERSTNGLESEQVIGATGALAFGLFHDFARDIHVQLELLGHTTERSSYTFETSDSELPAAADLLAAARWDRWTLRGTIGAEAFGPFAHAPLHTDAAVLTGFLPNERYGFIALEVRADWARKTPVVIAPEVVADGSPLGIPLLLGAALPFNLGASDTAESFGILLRLVLISERESGL